MKPFLLLSILAFSLHAGMSIGDKAYDFTLNSLDGKKRYALHTFKGDVVLVNLWASWCKGCKKEMPAFVALQKSYQKGFRLITVNLDDNPEKAQAFLHSVEKKTGTRIPFTSLYDPNKEVAKMYGCKAMPSSYLIDKEGKIRNIMVGTLHADEIEQLKHEINTLK